MIDVNEPFRVFKITLIDNYFHVQMLEKKDLENQTKVAQFIRWIPSTKNADKESNFVMLLLCSSAQFLFPSIARSKLSLTLYL